MAARFEERFLPLLDADSQLLPRPNHVDNNVFGAVPLELFLQTRKETFLQLGLMYADTQWDLPADASPCTGNGPGRVIPGKAAYGSTTCS